MAATKQDRGVVLSGGNAHVHPPMVSHESQAKRTDNNTLTSWFLFHVLVWYANATTTSCSKSRGL
jgi:hypothetical protein